MKTAYVAMAVDFIHPGHINIINKASTYGKVIIGLLTDDAISAYKKKPLLSYAERKIIFENIKGVDSVIPQESPYYTKNISAIRPDYVLHGDSWVNDQRCVIRQELIASLKTYGGTLIEIRETEGFSSTQLIKDFLESRPAIEKRRKLLVGLLNDHSFIRCLEVHSGISGLIAENSKLEKESYLAEFDAMWLSSLTDSASKGLPDTAVVSLDSRLSRIAEIFKVTTKPLIVDGDNGGSNSDFCLMVNAFEKMGVSAVIIEDKVGPKKNSLFGTSGQQKQDDAQLFSEKIRAGKAMTSGTEFLIIARIESLILNMGMGDAISRAEQYISAGADGIMIHSKDSSPAEILEFCSIYKSLKDIVPLVVVPSTYSQVTEEELYEAGVTIVIYANQLMRSSYPAMAGVATSILQHSRAHEAHEACMSVSEIISLIPENDS